MSTVVLKLRFVSGLADTVEQCFDAGATVCPLVSGYVTSG
jgi:hypothetical protein